MRVKEREGENTARVGRERCEIEIEIERKFRVQNCERLKETSEPAA